MGRVRARDVADLAGVSRTTVSFVLNNVPGMRISEETRQRVLEAARELDYHPDASARRLVTGKTRILAYVERQAPEHAFADAFMPQVLRGVHDAAATSSYEVLFAPIPLELSDGRFSRLLRGRHVDGIILSGPRVDDEELRQLIEANSPIVLQGQWPELSVASVDVDNIKAARLATEHLILAGHTRIGMIVHAPEAFTAGAARLQGYCEALSAHGLAFDPGMVEFANFTPTSGEEALDNLLRHKPSPSAVFISSDTVAIGAIRTAHERGIHIPDDLAIVGFDDIPMSVYLEPALTTVRLPAYGLGWAAADLLIRIIDDEETREAKILLDTELVIRGSCGSRDRYTKNVI
ncbi:MAG: substrate-binding domain-containing protein [Anaerolineales bacterium]|nr:substrate-binding domain-containing protein [Anaerolineales bacterium]